MADYMAWADDTAYRMRDYYEANRPLRWWEKRNPPGSWGCIADDLMLGLLDIALNCHEHFDDDPRVLYPWSVGARSQNTPDSRGDG